MKWSIIILAAATALVSADTRSQRQDENFRAIRQASANFTELNHRIGHLESLRTFTATTSQLAEAQIEMTSRAAAAALGTVVQTTMHIQSVSSSISDIGTADQSSAVALQDRLSTLQSTGAVMQSTLTQLSTSLGSAPQQFSQIASEFGDISGPGSIIGKLNQTFLSDPTIPVYRWKLWHTYSNSFSWFNGNSGNGFAGIAPSTWTDGNGKASDMANDWNYLNRLFTEKATASKFGATICAETRIFYSSTDGGVCGALFRINNPTNQVITWRPNMVMTSYSGWSETASISINRQNTWTSNCQNLCQFTANLPIPPNRISTVAFISSSSYSVGGSGSFYQRSTVLMFQNNALTLPGALTYRDDFDTLTGQWS